VCCLLSCRAVAAVGPDELLALLHDELMDQQQWQQLQLGYPSNIGSLQLRQVRAAM
jgi:hypothetical protein